MSNITEIISRTVDERVEPQRKKRKIVPTTSTTFYDLDIIVSGNAELTNNLFLLIQRKLSHKTLFSINHTEQALISDHAKIEAHISLQYQEEKRNLNFEKFRVHVDTLVTQANKIIWFYQDINIVHFLHWQKVDSSCEDDPECSTAITKRWYGIGTDQYLTIKIGCCEIPYLCLTLQVENKCMIIHQAADNELELSVDTFYNWYGMNSNVAILEEQDPTVEQVLDYLRRVSDAFLKN
jgi:hypothetical protein